MACLHVIIDNTMRRRRQTPVRPTDTGTAGAYYGIDLLIRSGRYEEATRRCDKMLRDNPNDTVARDYKDRALRDVAQATEKLRRSEEALRDDPEDFSCMVNKGMALMQLGRVEEALDHMDAVLRDDPDDCDVMYAKAVGLALNGRLGEARECHKLLDRTCPEHLCPVPLDNFLRLGEMANMVELAGT